MSKGIEDFFDRFGDAIFFGIILIIGTMAKAAMFPAISFDMEAALVPWCDYIVSHGHFKALKDNFADYNVTYLYLLSLATLLPVAKVTAVKLISMAFDFLGAFAAYKIVGLKYQNRALRMAAFLAVFLAPSVVANSALWGQCDMIHTAFILWSFYFALKKKGTLSGIFFGLAFAYKLQALLLLPVMAVFIINKQIKPRHLLYIPVVFFLMLFPSFAAGRDLVSLLSIYPYQIAHAGDYGMLSMQCANFYMLFNTGNYMELSRAGQYIALIACVAIVFYGFKMRKSLDIPLILKLAVFNALIVTYFLPNMHERYYFVADVASILLAFYVPRLFYMPVVIGFASMLSYVKFLKADKLDEFIPVDFKTLAAAFTAIIVLLAWELVRDVYGKKKEDGLTGDSGLAEKAAC